MKIENLREITDKASEAANKENLEHGDGTGVMVIRQSEYKYWEKDRTAREAMIRSGIEQWEAMKSEKQPDKCPVEPPAGYVAILGKDLPSPVPKRAMYGGIDQYAPWEWQDSIYAGATNTHEGHLQAWYAIPAAKGPQDQSARIKELEAEVEKIRRTNVNFTTAIESLSKELDFMATSRNKYRLDAEELQTKLAAAEKRVAELEWRQVSVKPTREDADASGYVVAIIEGHYSMEQWDDVGRPFNYWRPAALPKQTTPEEKSRAEFEAWWWKENEPSPDSSKAEAWKGWQAARKERA